MRVQIFTRIPKNNFRFNSQSKNTNLLESPTVKVPLELSLPPGSAQTLQNAVGKVREFQVRVSFPAY